MLASDKKQLQDFFQDFKQLIFGKGNALETRINNLIEDGLENISKEEEKRISEAKGKELNKFIGENF